MKRRELPKKHRLGKGRIAPSIVGDFSLPQSPPWMAVLCLLAFIASVIGLVLGYAGGSANRYLLFDHIATLTTEYILLEEHGFPMHKEIQTYSQLFTDRLMPLGYALLFHNPYIGVYLTSIFNWLVMAWGAFLLARRAGAGGIAWLAWPLVGLMALLVVLDATEEIFVTAITFGFRGGLNAMLPLMFWLTLSLLFAPSLKTTTYYLVAFVILFALLKFSYILFAPWFILPMMLTVGLALLSGRLKFSDHNWKILIAACVVGYLLEALLHQKIVDMFFIGEYVTDSSKGKFSLDIFLFSLRQFFVNWAANMVIKHPLLSFIWVGFLALSVRAVYIGFFRQLPKKQSLPMPLLCALSFLLFTLVVSIATTITFGQYYLWGRWWHFANHRYFMPAIYIPLFYGIPVLLAFYWPALRRHLVPSDSKIWGGIGVLAVIVLVGALPLFRHLPQISNLATYTSPFLQCAGAELEKRGLKTGIGSASVGGYLNGNLSYSHGIKTVPVFNTRAAVEIYQRKDFPIKQQPFRPFSATDKMPKDIEFAVANWTDARKAMLAPEIGRCPWRLENPQECYDYQWTPHAELFIKPEHITDYYGTPKETFRCEGVDFLVYK